MSRFSKHYNNNSNRNNSNNKNSNSNKNNTQNYAMQFVGHWSFYGLIIFTAVADVLVFRTALSLRFQHSVHVLTGLVLQWQQQHYKIKQTSHPNWTDTFGFDIDNSF